MSTNFAKFFSNISERNNDYSDTHDFRRGECEWGRWGWSRFPPWRFLIMNLQC